ncbi:NAD(P)-dependent dehydrogenase, short-chain alcohol dehydrogenase family [Solimonas aquatica]|uniref:NAD(P)-dependent dehydrogenase, short-chain alcohol dehydrogenase family n=2 Tax=Solimonas aquatica TaxID=489703 RepID=A0A1H9B947_9GAMM|nr:NAD(P)-dependent dehydrogenase, short-chain alcohol dehydrogenase family [Solimonas aquatica]
MVVGGTSGVGLATARQLALAGVPRLSLIGRNIERGKQAREDLLTCVPGLAVHFIACDANDLVQAQHAVAEAARLMGAVDILINCTADNARYRPEPLLRIAPESIAPTLLSVALPVMQMSRLVLPLMQARRGGVILNVASDAAKVPTPGETVLGAAMAAICVFSRTLAMEAKRYGVRVNALTPSLIEGTLTAAHVQESGFSAKLFEQVRSMASLGVCLPDDLAQLMVFLASPAAAKLTGQVISVNSGISAG